MIPRAPALRVRDLTIRYPAGETDALHEVSLTIGSGELVTVTGARGAGATTLALAAAGLIPRPIRALVAGGVALAEGRRPAIVLGRPSSQLSGARATVREEVAFGLENVGVPRSEMEQRIDAALARLAIEDLADRAPETLSSGEQQRLAIASVLAMAPGLLVVDEPTSHLDPAGALALSEILADAATDRTAVLAAEHHPAILARAQRTVLLQRGRVVADDLPGLALAPEPAEAAGFEAPAIVRLAATAGVEPSRAFDEAVVGRALATAARGHALHRPATPGASAGAVHWQPIRDQPPGTVEIAGLVHRYPSGVVALRGLDLAVKAGEAVAIVGANGSGKTTLAKHLNGLLHASEGFVRVAGTDVAARPVHRNAAIVGFAFAAPADMLFERTVDAEVRLGPRRLGLAPAEADALVQAALSAAGIEDRRDANPHDLGPADQRLVALAAAVATDPAVLVLDEPTSGLDPAGTRRVGAIVDALRATGRTVVAITHDMDLAAAHADRVVVLHDGRIVADGPARDVFDPDRAPLLAEAGLRPPLAARIAALLDLDATPLDIDELLGLVSATFGTPGPP